MNYKEKTVRANGNTLSSNELNKTARKLLKRNDGSLPPTPLCHQKKDLPKVLVDQARSLY